MSARASLTLSFGVLDVRRVLIALGISLLLLIRIGPSLSHAMVISTASVQPVTLLTEPNGALLADDSDMDSSDDMAMDSDSDSMDMMDSDSMDSDSMDSDSMDSDSMDSDSMDSDSMDSDSTDSDSSDSE